MPTNPDRRPFATRSILGRSSRDRKPELPYRSSRGGELMKVEADYVCEHGMPQPWATCTECMLLPFDLRPIGPRPVPAPKRPVSRPGVMPKTADDPIPDLIGDRDLSFPVWDFAAHRTGEDNDWLFGGQGFPWSLRAGGWIYLRHDGVLGARVRVRGIGFREERKEHTGDPREILGAGPTIELFPDSWEDFDEKLGDLAESQRQGYRYLITSVDSKIKHLMANEPLPANFEIDPPVSVSPD